MSRREDVHARRNRKLRAIRWRLGGALALGIVLFLLGMMWMTMSNEPSITTQQGSPP